MSSATAEATAKLVRCPKCNAQPHFSCRTSAVRWRALKHPHQERITASQADTQPNQL